MVLALGGGAFVDPETREQVRRAPSRSGCAPISRRCSPHRAQAGHAARCWSRATRARYWRGLMEERYPIYAVADYTVDTQSRAARESWSSGSWRWSSRRRRQALSAMTDGSGEPGRAELRDHHRAPACWSGPASCCAPLVPLRRTIVVTDENLARTPRIRAGSAAALERAGIASRTDRAAAGRGHQELAFARAAGRGAAGATASSGARR